MGFGAPLIWTALSLLFVALPKPAASCDGGLDCVGGVKAEAAHARTTMMRVILGLSSVQPQCRALDARSSADWSAAVRLLAAQCSLAQQGSVTLFRRTTGIATSAGLSADQNESGPCETRLDKQCTAAKVRLQCAK